MDQNDFLALVAEILETDVASVTLTSSLDDLDWDSLSNITFIAEADSRYGASINADQLATADTVSDLLDLVTSAKTSA